jgi:hypothetical protein
MASASNQTIFISLDQSGHGKRWQSTTTSTSLATTRSSSTSTTTTRLRSPRMEHSSLAMASVCARAHNINRRALVTEVETVTATEIAIVTVTFDEVSPMPSRSGPYSYAGFARSCRLLRFQSPWLRPYSFLPGEGRRPELPPREQDVRRGQSYMALTAHVAYQGQARHWQSVCLQSSLNLTVLHQLCNCCQPIFSSVYSRRPWLLVRF